MPADNKISRTYRINPQTDLSLKTLKKQMGLSEAKIIDLVLAEFVKRKGKLEITFEE